jgi:hypothetical protein
VPEWYTSDSDVWPGVRTEDRASAMKLFHDALKALAGRLDVLADAASRVTAGHQQRSDQDDRDRQDNAEPDMLR